MRTLFALVLTLAVLAGCQPRQASRSTTSQDATQVASGSATASGSAAAEAKLRAEKQLVINQLNEVLTQLKKEGIEVRKTPVKKAWRLIVPALATMSPQARAAEVKQLETTFRGQMEPVMQRPIEVEIFADPAEQQRLN